MLLPNEKLYDMCSIVQLPPPHVTDSTHNRDTPYNKNYWHTLKLYCYKRYNRYVCTEEQYTCIVNCYAGSPYTTSSSIIGKCSVTSVNNTV